MHDIVKNINLGIRFVLELCMLASFGYWGYHCGNSDVMNIVAAIGIPLAVAVVWGLFLSPKAKVKLPLGLRVIMELVLFCLAGLLLYLSGKELQGELLAAVFIINRAILLAFKA